MNKNHDESPPKQRRGARPAGGAAMDEQWRWHNVGRLLNNSISRFESRILDLMARSGHARCKISHIQVTRNLDVGGTRLTDLAARAAITKQSMGALVTELEELGVVRRDPDPEDARARIVCFTPDGLDWLDSFHAALTQAEAEIRAELGSDLFDCFKKALVIYGENRG